MLNGARLISVERGKWGVIDNEVEVSTEVNGFNRFQRLLWAETMNPSSGFHHRGGDEASYTTRASSHYCREAATRTLREYC